MSLATFKKKTINSIGATKRSGKSTNMSWFYQGPYGKSDTLSSEIYKSSIINDNNSGFSINGPYRNIGGVGSNMNFSKSGTPYRGIYPKGWGGNCGRYPDGLDNIKLNIGHVITGVSNQGDIVKSSVLSTKGMMDRRFRWIKSGQYPVNWVQPIYTGNQVDSASQGVYIQNKSAKSYIWSDVNDSKKFENYYNKCDKGCKKSNGGSYKMNMLMSNGAYTKTLYRPKDSSDYTLEIQRLCKDPVGLQKPFPYAVQTGTGILRGGINVNNVGSACNIGVPVLSPPDWYTGVMVKPDGTKTTLLDQLQMRV
jgi:hypothetical protein